MKHKIKGDISSWNSSVWDFNYMMRSVKEDEEIDLEINSYGGDVFVGIDLMNTLRGHKGKVTITITGIAASAAGLICMGADVVRMYSNTQFMLHHAWTVVAGNAKKLRKTADDLDSVGESVLASYTHRLDETTAKKLLEEESYLSASKALKLGLADEIVDGKAEVVESEIFKDHAEKFNNQITLFSDNDPGTDNEQISALKAQIHELKNEFSQLKNQSKDPDPVPAPAATETRIFF
ncbi:head maturation protease, ClpP-related [Paenibacillus sp. M2]|uniref:head maturation protease, ClpP-related n=1 Tax=Paenibacillus sp. M2 TaxID=3341793 RepID=UPI00398A4D17